MALGPANTVTSKLSITSLGLRTPSKYNPPHIYHATETFISLVDREVKQFSHEQQLGLYPVHSNLSLVEKQALSSLQNNKSITIKPADKGGAIVVMNYSDYNKEVIRQLSDSNTYGVIQRDPVRDITTKIKSLLNGTSNSMLEFVSQLNSIHPELQFTLHHSTESVPFLDTLVMKDIEGNLSTDLYCKPTDSNSLLHYSSCHPKTTKNSLPRSQFDRVSRIVSNPEIRQERLDSTAHKFELRHYPPKLLDFEKTRALTPPSPQPPMYPRERIPFVHTFHPTMPRVYSIIKKHWPLLSKAYPEIDSFKAPTLICTKRPSNIRDNRFLALRDLYPFRLTSLLIVDKFHVSPAPTPLPVSDPDVFEVKDILAMKKVRVPDVTSFSSPSMFWLGRTRMTSQDRWQHHHEVLIEEFPHMTAFEFSDNQSDHNL
ncbi:unnamed protein product [Ranitomeya imitator]|uniref:Helix-turn-helix domain-containing protein n=1 Tax=Ranitomeya imitator TaxID=111125 RepID=A0ABN9LT96_9NEOB|nr:unnamed protein product [Ranitomeya imitator]